MTSQKLKAIKGYKSFELVIQAGKKFYLNEAMAVVVFREYGINERIYRKNPPDEGTIYFGVSAGKRVSKKAVVRNRLKRLLRESIKRIVEASSLSGSFSEVEFILIFWKQPVDYPGQVKLGYVEAIINSLLSKAIQYHQKLSGGKET